MRHIVGGGIGKFVVNLHLFDIKVYLILTSFFVNILQVNTGHQWRGCCERRIGFLCEKRRQSN